MRAAIQHVYAPWLRDAAELFQERVEANHSPAGRSPRLGDVPAGTCVLFADGLRFDVGQKLLEALQGRVGSIELTSTPPPCRRSRRPPSPPCRPWRIRSPGSRPARSSARRSSTTEGPDHRSLPQAPGRRRAFQVLSGAETGDPRGRAWTEFGNLDQTGHEEGIGLARRIPELLADLVARIESLLEAGWQEVRVVTDHGWLLVPGGLAQGGPAQVPDGDPLGAVCRGEALRPRRSPLLPLVLVGGRAGRLSPRHRLLHRGQGIQSRRAEPAGVRGPAALRPA